MNTNLPKYIYHYCTLPTFSHIVENKTIRLSDIRKSNDSKEIEWFLENFRDYISTELVKSIRTHTDSIKETSSILQQMKSVSLETCKKDELVNRLSALEEHIEIENKKKDSYEELYNFFKQKYWSYVAEPYVICFSRFGDSLSQWRGYGDDGYGVSIGFKMDYFEKILSNESNQMNPYNSLILSEVCYEEDLDTIFESIITDIPNAYNENSYDADDKEVNIYLTLLRILSIAPLYKNPSFIEESEWRLLSLVKSIGIDEQLKFDDSFWDEHNEQTQEIKRKFKLIKRDYFIRNKALVSFLELKILNIAEAIGEIVIGPKSNISIAEMEDYLQLKGIRINSKHDDCSGVNVIKSKSSYTDKL